MNALDLNRFVIYLKSIHLLYSLISLDLCSKNELKIVFKPKMRRVDYGLMDRLTSYMAYPLRHLLIAIFVGMKTLIHLSFYV